MEIHKEAISESGFNQDRVKHKHFRESKKSSLLTRQTPLKKKIVFVLLTVILFAFVLFTANFFAETNSVNNQTSTFEDPKGDYPLLLNSGLVDAQEAELRIVFWFEKGKPHKDFNRELPQEGWVWQESTISNPLSKGYSLAGYTIINPDTEKSIFNWYKKQLNDVAKENGILYLDERVREDIDIVQYAIKQNILPRQFSLTEKTISVAGWQESRLPEVAAGDDIINIQMISQGYGQGKTALAIPALLEEF